MGVLAPAQTPGAVVSRLHDAIARAVADPAVNAGLAEQAVELHSSTPAEFARFIRAEHDKWRKVITDAKLDLRQ
jgi:tripartite-type tricarboxylate transporter receptor subunit TctC